MEVQEAFWKTLLFRGKFSVRYFNESVKNVTYRILSKIHRTLSYTKRIWKQWLFWTLSFISDFSGVTVGGTVRGDQSRKSTEVVYVTIHNEERSRYHTGGNKDWRLISVIIFVYSSSTSLFDMYRYMYDVDGVIFNQKITEKKNQKTYYF